MNVFLETPRLILRNLTEDDVENLVTLDSDPDVMRYINGGIASSREAIAREFLPNILSYYERYEHFGFWAIVEKSSQEFIGWVLFRPEADFTLAQLFKVIDDAVELGYRLRKISWGKGYATEVSQALVNKGFTEWDVSAISAWVLAENKASLRVLEKVGLKPQQEYVLTANIFRDAGLLDNPIVRSLLDRTMIRWQLDKTTWKLASPFN